MFFMVHVFIYKMKLWMMPNLCIAKTMKSPVGNKVNRNSRKVNI